jgi:hypothetical protein
MENVIIEMESVLSPFNDSYEMSILKMYVRELVDVSIFYTCCPKAKMWKSFDRAPKLLAVTMVTSPSSPILNEVATFDFARWPFD